MEEIRITDIENIRIGQTENAEAGTGCTVLICKKGMRAGADIRGGGPASRETPLLDPLKAAQTVHAVVLGGGSAYGLDAAGGVMELLEQRGIGLDVVGITVPLVVQSDIFDLTVGDPYVRPDKRMGYEAARLALDSPNYRDGCFGAGCGATVGKLCGMEYCMKTGIGSYTVKVGALVVGAVVTVNALGDIFDHRTGRKIAGLLSEDKRSFRSSADVMISGFMNMSAGFAANTTIGAVITNAALDKAQLCKVASMAQNGLARSIDPVHTSMDGDSVYAVSVGDIPADQDLMGTLAAEVMSCAIERAVYSAESAYGFPAAKDIRF